MRARLAWFCVGCVGAIGLGCGAGDWRGRHASSNGRAADAGARGSVAQYRFEPSHQGVTTASAKLAQKPSVVWSRGPLGIGSYDASKSSPAIADDHVYVGQDDGRLWALERDTGETGWTFATRRHYQELGRTDGAFTGIHGSPAFDEKNAYIGDYAGWLYAVDRQSGALAWETQLGGSIGSSPVLDGGRIWIAVEFPMPDGRVFAVRPSDGAVLLASDYLGDHIHGTVSLGEGPAPLIIGTNQGRVYGLARESLGVAWTQPLDGAVKSTAAIVAGVALVTAWDGALHALDLATGRSHFTVATQDRSMSSPAVWDGVVCFGSHDHSLTCADLTTGQIRWRALTEGVVSSSPIILAEARLVVVGSVDGSLYAYRLDDGTLAWLWSLGAPITSVPVAVDGSLFVNDNRGTVWRLDASDGLE